jgi:hypothetical protein
MTVFGGREALSAGSPPPSSRGSRARRISSPARDLRTDMVIAGAARSSRAQRRFCPLLATYISAKSAGCDLKLINLTQRIKELLYLTRLASVFEGYGDSV